MRSFKTEGIVIKRTNFNEADRIVTIFTKRNGKIKIKASGVRRITSRRSPHIEPLNYAIFNLYQGKSMATLIEVDCLEDFSNLKTNLKKMGYAFHVLELIDSLCAENQENLEIFELLDKTLKRISKEEDSKKVIYEFELKLLSLLGFYTHSEELFAANTQVFIAQLLERKLKTKQIIPQLS